MQMCLRLVNTQVRELKEIEIKGVEVGVTDSEPAC